MLVTITTDASWHREKKAGGFAFWAVCNKWRITKSGPLRKNCASPANAEMKCIINAVHAISEDKEVQRIIINTDCMNAIYVFTDNQQKIKKYGLRQLCHLGVTFRQMVGGKYEVEFRHVKAHGTINSARTWVNDWCDKEAKKAMWDKVNTKK